MSSENEMAAPVTAAEELDAVLYWRDKHATAIKERDALQLRLSAKDQLNDTATLLIRRMVANFDTEIRYHEDVEPNDLEHDLVLSEMHEFLNPKDGDWHMNPCKQGHRDVGAAGGVAHCYTCDEKVEASTTQEAFERWNATHSAAKA
ncbi:hypothetical protein [Pseudomonas sp. 58(2021)]|uniref:hypothetical protein n=1 Tax=Pseudomonas sp. 58(2021) TaxID=2813330 RepID=UPI001A9DA9E4|nr:hypothetical protein [Pseudomonas sp. 58(2021)]